MSNTITSARIVNFTDMIVDSVMTVGRLPDGTPVIDIRGNAQSALAAYFAVSPPTEVPALPTKTMRVSPPVIEEKAGKPASNVPQGTKELPEGMKEDHSFFGKTDKDLKELYAKLPQEIRGRGRLPNAVRDIAIKLFIKQREARGAGYEYVNGAWELRGVAPQTPPVAPPAPKPQNYKPAPKPQHGDGEEDTREQIQCPENQTRQVMYRSSKRDSMMWVVGIPLADGTFSFKPDEDGRYVVGFIDRAAGDAPAGMVNLRIWSAHKSRVLGFISQDA